jgi:tetratricopeptide (TPR) repeat protein
VPSRRLLIPACSLILATLTFAQTSSPSATATEVAETNVAHATADAPTPKFDAFREAQVMMQLGDYSKAIPQFKAAIQADPKAGAAYAGLVRAYLYSGDSPDAYGLVRDALQKVPDSQDVQVANAEVLFRQGTVEAAGRAFATAINTGGPNARAYLGMYKVRSALSQRAAARAMVGAAFDKDPLDPAILWAYLFSKKPTDRPAVVEKLVAREDLDPRVRADLKDSLEYLNKAAAVESHTCKLSRDVKTTELQLVNMMSDPKHLLGYGLDVKLNDKKALMLVDSGATGLTINKGTANRAGVKKLFDSKVGGIGDKGWRDAYIGYVDSIKIGDLEFQDCIVEVTDRSTIDDGGLIGTDVFNHFLVTLNLPTEKMKLSPLPGPQTVNMTLNTTDDDNVARDALDNIPELQGWSKFVRRGHDVLVGTRVNNGDLKLFLLDTGAWDNTMSPQAAREVTKVKLDDMTEVKGISGKVKKVYRAKKATIQFADLRQELEDIAVLDMSGISDNAGIEISGTLGFRMLKLLEINIDYRDGYVKFNYDEKAASRRRR